MKFSITIINFGLLFGATQALPTEDISADNDWGCQANCQSKYDHAEADVTAWCDNLPPSCSVQAWVHLTPGDGATQYGSAESGTDKSEVTKTILAWVDNYYYGYQIQGDDCIVNGNPVKVQSGDSC